MQTNEEKIELKVILTLFNSWFSPSGISVSSIFIEKSFQRFIRNFKVSLAVVGILLSCSFNVDFICRLKECPEFLRCKSAGIDFGLVKFFLLLFSLISNPASAFPTY